jgi:hypothetical protein
VAAPPAAGAEAPAQSVAGLGDKAALAVCGIPLAAGALVLLAVTMVPVLVVSLLFFLPALLPLMLVMLGVVATFGK